MWLFRFPLFRNTRYRVDRNSAAISFVVVLPALPVMATTRAPDRRRTSRAMSCSARVVSSTSTITQPRRRPRPSGRSRRDASTSTPRAPRASASATNCVAVEPLAANRDEEIPRAAACACRSRSASIACRRVAAHEPPAGGGRDVPGGQRQPFHAATTPCEPARRRASAARATSTSSNGSTRSPITWYFS